MSNINICVFSGRLIEDPEISEGENPICKFMIAVNRTAGAGKERTAFVPITVFGNQAPACGEFLKKGRSVNVHCHLETDLFTDKDGNQRKGFDFVADNVEFGPKPAEKEPSKPVPQPDARPSTMPVRKTTTAQSWNKNWKK